MARSCSCNDFTRSQLLRRGAAVAGRGLPRIEPGMPLPAGTGMDRRTFLLRSAGAALSVYGASMLSPRHFEEGIAQAAAAAAPKQPVLVSIFMEGGWDALSVLAPGEGTAVQQLRPALGLPKAAGKAFSEDESLMWHPSAAGLAEAPRRGQGDGLPGDRLRPAGREPLHEPPLLGGRRARRQRALGLDGALPGPGRRTRQPAAGPLAGLHAGPALATAKMPVAAVSSPSDYTLWAYGLGEPLTGAGACRPSGAGRPPGALARLRAGARRLLDTSLILDQMAPFVGSEGKPGYTSPVTYPTTGGEFPERLAALAAMLAAGLPIKCASLNAVGSYDTHSDEAGTLTTNLGADRRIGAGLPARPGSPQTG